MSDFFAITSNLLTVANRSSEYRLVFGIERLYLDRSHYFFYFPPLFVFVVLGASVCNQDQITPVGYRPRLLKRGCCPFQN